MEKLWVNQCGWLQLCTTFAIGMTITNFWKLFRCGVKRDHYEKFIGIREFLERLAIDCFNSPSSTDTGTLSKNIPPLDEVDEGQTFSTSGALHFYSYIYPSAAASTISDITLNSSLSIFYTSVTSTIEYQNNYEI